MLSVERVSQVYSTRRDDIRSCRTSAFSWNGGAPWHPWPHGAGKSTLIRLNLRRRTPNIRNHPPRHERVLAVGIRRSFSTNLTGLDNLKFVCRIYGRRLPATNSIRRGITELGPYFRRAGSALFTRNDDAARLCASMAIRV